MRWAQVELRLGHIAVVIGASPDLVIEYPLAEPLEGLLMRALRVAETLDRYPPSGSNWANCHRTPAARRDSRVRAHNQAVAVRGRVTQQVTAATRRADACG
jgi:hypothetical protein